MQNQNQNRLWFNLFSCKICRDENNFISASRIEILKHLRELHFIEIWREEEELLPFLDDYLDRKQERYIDAFGGSGGSSVSCGGVSASSVSSLTTTWWGGNHDFEGRKVDEELRSSCRLERLTHVLQIQESEITTSSSHPSFSCLFCKKFPATPSRTLLFSHFYQEHSLLIGAVNNIVFLHDFLALLRERLDGRVCLYCEKEFPDHVTLRRHMRKKNHFQINPNNREYDRFYIKNYMEKEVGPRKSLSQGVLQLSLDDVDGADQEHEDEAEWDDWNEPCQDGETQCLFDESIHSSPEECHQHMISAHSFNLFTLPLTSFYQRIRLVNYLRYMSHSCTCYICKQVFPNLGGLSTHYSKVHANQFTLPHPEEEVWANPSFLFPYIDGDSLLLLDTGDDEDEGLVEGKP